LHLHAASTGAAIWQSVHRPHAAGEAQQLLSVLQQQLSAWLPAAGPCSCIIILQQHSSSWCEGEQWGSRVNAMHRNCYALAAVLVTTA
jgi:hypothetical protein